MYQCLSLEQNERLSMYNAHLLSKGQIIELFQELLDEKLLDRLDGRYMAVGTHLLESKCIFIKGL